VDFKCLSLEIDHVWHLPPSEWEPRFHRIFLERTLKNTLEAILASTIPAEER